MNKKSKKGFTQHLLLGHKQSNKLTSKKGAGFTLIELLVVIAIIGLLSTLAVVALNSARQKARDVKRIADIKQVQTALELYLSSAEEYPHHDSDPNDSVVLGDEATCLGSDGFATNCSGSTIYMGLLPSAPEPPSGDTYAYSAGEIGVGNCQTIADNCVIYEIDFSIEGDVEGFNAGALCAMEIGIVQGVCPDRW